MDDSLKDLLEAESEAEEIVSDGETERDVIVQKALDDAHAMEQQFKNRLPEMYKSFSDKAVERAVQTIAELKLRYDERNQELREMAQEHQQEALSYAIDLILETGKEHK